MHKFKKKKKECGIKGSRFNATCTCGQSLRVRLNPTGSFNLVGARIIGYDRLFGIKPIKESRAIIGVNPNKCPKCGDYATAIEIDTKSKWYVVEQKLLKPSNKKWRHRRRDYF